MPIYVHMRRARAVSRRLDPRPPPAFPAGRARLRLGRSASCRPLRRAPGVGGFRAGMGRVLRRLLERDGALAKLPQNTRRVAVVISAIAQ